MKLGKYILAAVLAASSVTAEAAIRYDFNALSAGNGVTGSFSYTVPDFIAGNGMVSTSSLSSCVIRTPANGQCGPNQSFYADTSSLIGSHVDDYDAISFGQGFSGGNFYYFENGAFSHLGTYTSILFSDQVGTLSVSNVTAVPEPASWAMMIVGVGAVGGTLRTRRRRTGMRVRLA